MNTPAPCLIIMVMVTAMLRSRDCKPLLEAYGYVIPRRSPSVAAVSDRSIRLRNRSLAMVSKPPPSLLLRQTLRRANCCVLFICCSPICLSLAFTGKGHTWVDQRSEEARYIASKLPWYGPAYSPHDVPAFYDVAGITEDPLCFKRSVRGHTTLCVHST